MKHLKRIKQGLCLAVVLCAGCSGSDYNNSQPAVSQPPAGATSLDYTSFVQGQFITLPGANETTTPVDVESTQFTFADQDNTTAFDSTITAAP